jgi:hypothetical protein
MARTRWAALRGEGDDMGTDAAGGRSAAHRRLDQLGAAAEIVVQLAPGAAAACRRAAGLHVI